MQFDRANLPESVAELQRIIAAQVADIAAEREARTARETELATAKAGLLAQALEIEKLKLQIARLRRQQFGRSSEKIERTIGQLGKRAVIRAFRLAPALGDDRRDDEIDRAGVHLGIGGHQ
jgi:Transposase C of IS166 homeodomain